jgi:RND family efflux transporter MFP subunit
MTDVSDLKQQLEALRLDEDDPRPRPWKWIGLAAALLLIVGAGLAWRVRAGAATEVETVTPTVQENTNPAAGAPILTASGYVVARRKAVVSAKIQGRLSDLRVEEGSRVAEGEVIARLESADYEASVGRARARVEAVRAQIASADALVTRAQADLAEAKRQAGLTDRLADELVASVDDRDAARSRVAVAEAALAQARASRAQADADPAQAEADVRFAEAQLQNTVIRAPFSGTVVKKMAEVGESVAPIPPGVNISTSSGAIVALADLDTLEVEVDVSESNVARLGDDQPVEVTVEAFPDRKYRGALRQVIPTADRTKATVMVKVTILDKDRDLKPEMSAKATFLERAGAGTATPAPSRRVLVPQSAVVTRNGATQVFEVIEGTRARARRVETAPAQQDQLLVKDGLIGTEVLVNRPPESLKDGDPVRVKGRS